MSITMRLDSRTRRTKNGADGFLSRTRPRLCLRIGHFSVILVLTVIAFAHCNANNEFGKGRDKSSGLQHKNDVTFRESGNKLYSDSNHDDLDHSDSFTPSVAKKVIQQSRKENELNTVPAFNALGGHEDGEELVEELGDEEDDEYGGSYEDEPPTGSNNEWGTDFDNNDENEIVSIEKHHGGKPAKDKDRDYIQDKRPQMAKCCKMGEGLNSQGQCKPHHRRHKTEQEMNHERQHYFADSGTNITNVTDSKIHTSWFPTKVFHIEHGEWIAPNPSDWHITVGHFVHCPENESSELISDITKFAITNHGDLFVLHRENKEVKELDFCVDLLLGDGKLAVRSCFTQTELCDSKLPCLRKCCPEDALVEEPSGECVFSATHKQISKFPTDKWNVVHGSPTCPHGQYLKEVTGHFSIDIHDARFTSSSANATFENYCLDYFLESSKFSQQTHNMQNTLEAGADPQKEVTPIQVKMPVLKVVTCFEHYEDQYESRLKEAGLVVNPRWVSVTYGITLIISAFCILMAALISWRLPELHSLHGKCQLCHLATLFCLFTLLAITHLNSEDLPTEMCTAFALIIHIFALSAFLWLNLLCVNIYLTFRSLRPPLAARRGENRRLFFLCVYAWGIPAAFCLFMYLLETFEPGRLEPMPAPGYGVLICLISNRPAQFLYLYGPVGVLLFLNGVLFCLTAKELLCGLWRLDNSDSINFRRKSMGIVVGKLGVVMGMGWILDVLSWGVGGPEFPYVFYASDLFNALQGVFIFLVLIWRKRVLEMLHLRKPSLFKDDTMTGRPFLPKSSVTTLQTNGGGGGSRNKNGRGGREREGTEPDADTSLVLVGQDHA